ncbi:MAG: GntR family transcriptional regulator [Pseudomonadota bacterium]|nr:GntR family transcriptional regulator [Pseudomonadota bacterium]
MRTVAIPAHSALSSQSPTPAFRPLYRQIKAAIVAGLQAGEWQPGQAIPSEFELAARFGVSQGTVRKAVDEMAADNLLVRRQGKGTFVATHAEPATQYRFLRLMPDGGAERAVPLERLLLDCRRLRAPADVARALALSSGEAAVQVRRLLLLPRSSAAVGAAGATPLVFDDLWLPGSLFAGLTADRLAAWRGPLYRLFEAEFSVHMVRAEEKIRAVAATAETARRLQQPVGMPLLSVERRSFTYDDQPVEWRRGLYLTTAHHYRSELS